MFTELLAFNHFDEFLQFVERNLLVFHQCVHHAEIVFVEELVHHVLQRILAVAVLRNLAEIGRITNYIR